MVLTLSWAFPTVVWTRKPIVLIFRQACWFWWEQVALHFRNICIHPLHFGDVALRGCQIQIISTASKNYFPYHVSNPSGCVGSKLKAYEYSVEIRPESATPTDGFVDGLGDSATTHAVAEIIIKNVRMAIFHGDFLAKKRPKCRLFPPDASIASSVSSSSQIRMSLSSPVELDP